MTETKAARDKRRAGELAVSAGIDMRRVLLDARLELEEFEQYVDSWDEMLRERDPREFRELYVVERALAKLGEIEHMPTGGTRHMHLRNARTRLLQLLSGA